MAGSRLERIGTIFSRTTGLLRSNVIKYEDRPIWYDIYRVFPPTLEPHFDREPKLPEGVSEEVPEIFYEEDVLRASEGKVKETELSQKHPPKRQTKVIRAETLLSMFQDAKDQKSDTEPPKS